MTTENSIIDSVMAEAAASAQEAPKVDDNEPEAQDQPEIEEAVTESQDEGDKDEGDQEEAGEDNNDDLPKNVKKALDKNKRYIRNLREREKNLLAEIEKLKTEKYEPKQIDEENYEGTYGDLYTERALEKMRAELSQNQNKQQLDQLTLQQQQIAAEQNQAISIEAAEYAKQSEDFAKVVPASAERFNVLPAEIQGLFFELESPTLAAYALAKEGKIEQLAFMSPYMAAAELHQAQQRGQQYLQSSSKKAVSNAPAPVNGVRGTAKTAPSRLNEKSPDALYKWIQS